MRSYLDARPARRLGHGLRFLGLALAWAGLLHAGPSQAATWAVDDAADLVDAAPGDGACAAASGTCTLRAAIQEANALAGPDVIVLPPGTYSLALPGRNEDAGATGDLDITSSLTIEGDCPATTIVDGGLIDRVLHVLPGGALTASRMTLRGGDVDAPWYWLPFGGGLFNQEGDVTLDRCRLTGNRALDGGGAYVASLGLTRLRLCTIDDNFASVSAGGVGRGVLAPDGGPLELVNCTVTGNHAQSGGGGGLGVSGAPTLLRQCTVAGNSTGSGGGGITGLVRAGHSVISGNTADVAGTEACWGEIESLGRLLFDTDPTAGGDCVIAGDVASIVLGDPLLDALADNGGATPTRALLAGSAAIDAGSPDPPGSADAECEPEDQRGGVRPSGPACDIGAFELGSTPESCGGDRDGDGVSDGEDACPESDLASTVRIGDCDTGVANTLGPDGCSLADRIRLCAEQARNHGDFVSCVARLAREVSAVDRGRLQRCAARSRPR